jgi:hypothetical protein
LSVPLSKYKPENQLNDICVVTFVGKGRGRGFEKGEEISILGDQKITPVTVKRVCELYKFFQVEGYIPNLHVQRIQNIQNVNTIISLQNTVDTLTDELNEIKNEIKEKRLLEEKLSYIKSITNSHIEINLDHELILNIEFIDEDAIDDLILFFAKMGKSERIKLLSRITSNSENINDFFNSLLFIPKKKLLSDILLEMDLSFPIELGKDGDQYFYDFLETRKFLRDLGKMGKNNSI